MTTASPKQPQTQPEPPVSSESAPDIPPATPEPVTIAIRAPLRDVTFSGGALIIGMIGVIVLCIISFFVGTMVGRHAAADRRGTYSSTRTMNGDYSLPGDRFNGSSDQNSSDSTNPAT